MCCHHQALGGHDVTGHARVSEKLARNRAHIGLGRRLSEVGYHGVSTREEDAMIGKETRMRLRHYLERGMTKVATAGGWVNRRPAYRWIASSQLDQELG